MLSVWKDKRALLEEMECSNKELNENILILRKELREKTKEIKEIEELRERLSMTIGNLKD